MKILNSLIGFLLLLSCSGAGKIQEQGQSISNSWVVVRIGEKELPLNNAKDYSGLPLLLIQGEEMKYTGGDGCNRIMGGLIELDSNTIRFGIYAGTQMMCPEMEIPDLFNRTLGKVRSWEIKKNQLHLFDEEGTELMQLIIMDAEGS